MKRIRTTLKPLQWVTKPSTYARRPFQPDEPELPTQQKMAILCLLLERTYLPVLKGEVDIRKIMTPARGWKSVEAAHPAFWNLPPLEQFKIAHSL